MRYFGYVTASALVFLLQAPAAAQAEVVDGARYATHMGEVLSGPQGVNQRLRQARSRVPHGYQRAWTDGRLNGLRAAGTPSGRRAMEQVWTDTVPRKLIRK